MVIKTSRINIKDVNIREESRLHDTKNYIKYFKKKADTFDVSEYFIKTYHWIKTKPEKCSLLVCA